MTAEMVGCVASTLQELEGLAADVFLLFLEPGSFDERIVNQFALFSLLSNAQLSLGSWIDRHEALARRIVIPPLSSGKCATSSTRRTSPSACCLRGWMGSADS